MSTVRTPTPSHNSRNLMCIFHVPFICPNQPRILPTSRIILLPLKNHLTLFTAFYAYSKTSTLVSVTLQVCLLPHVWSLPHFARIFYTTSISCETIYLRLHHDEVVLYRRRQSVSVRINDAIFDTFIDSSPSSVLLLLICDICCCIVTQRRNSVVIEIFGHHFHNYCVLESVIVRSVFVHLQWLLSHTMSVINPYCHQTRCDIHTHLDDAFCDDGLRM